MHLKALLITLRTSMWFIPMTLVGLAILLAYACISIDNAATLDFAHHYPQPFAGGADSIRMMLSAIATSMITVSGITFSLTISSLAQVSGQLTARVLRNFMSNLTNKLVLGFFVGLFVYCLLVMRCRWALYPGAECLNRYDPGHSRHWRAHLLYSLHCPLRAGQHGGLIGSKRSSDDN